MPITDGIIVPIVADANGLNKGMNDARTAVTKFGADGTAQVYKFSESISRLTLKLGDLKKELTEATKVTDVARIQNDINAVTARISEQQAAYRKLGGEATSALTNIKQGYSVIRQAAFALPGIGVSGIFLLAFEGVKSLAQELGFFKDKSTDAAEANEKFKESVDKAAASAAKDGIALQAYINIAKDGKLPLEERNQALKEANKLFGDHGEKITLANVATEKITLATNGYTEAIIKNAVAQKYADKIADAYIVQKNAATALAEALKNLNDLEGDKSTLNVTGRANNNQYPQELSNRQKAVRDATKANAEAQKEYNKQLFIFDDLIKDANAAIAKFGDGKKEKTDKKPAKERLPLVQKTKIEETVDSGNNKFYASIRRENEMLKEQTVLVRGIAPAFTEAYQKAYIATMKAEIAQIELKNALVAVGLFVVNDLNRAFDTFFSNLVQNGRLSISELIGDIGKMITRLLAAAAAAATLSAILSIATGGGSTIGSFLGVGGSFKDIFKNLFSSASGIHLASGGITNGPTRALIGEGKEREVVTPLSQLKNIIGSGGGNIALPVPQLFMRGSDFWLMYQKNQLLNRRTY